jgi:two-component system cell cycle response regulator DivK
VAYTILIVEDTTDTRDLMSTILRLEGYRVLEARNGRDAVKMAIRELPDVILMDMSLPVMDGCEATVNIRKQPELAAVPIIACTATISGNGEAKQLLQGVQTS